RGVVLDVFRPPQLARPLAAGELAGGMRVEEAAPVQGHLLEASLQAPVQSAALVPQGDERLLQGRKSVVVRSRRGGPEDARLPPALGVPRRPGDAVVVGAGRAGDAVVVRRQAREVGARDHGGRRPRWIPHSTQAWAERRTLPAASGGTGFSPVMASKAQNHWS